MSEVARSVYHAMFDPWAEARRIPGLEVKITRLPAFLQGCTDGRVIYLDDRLTEREKRCALTHELVHLDMGHGECQPPAVERRVRAITAALLIPERMLKDTLRWTQCPYEAAEELSVTVPVLRDRVGPSRGEALLSYNGDIGDI